MLSQVGAALEFRDYLEKGDEILEFAKRDLRRREACLDEGRQLVAASIEVLLAGDDTVGGWDVLIEKRSGSPTDALGDQIEQDSHRFVDAKVERCLIR
ncbi:MAG TPA: hypothetical protein VKU86_07775 [Acidimicrobiales bacterium]|nr:hypothetical protein [Acidimicrobiales bacterium]